MITRFILPFLVATVGCSLVQDFGYRGASDASLDSSLVDAESPSDDAGAYAEQDADEGPLEDATPDAGQDGAALSGFRLVSSTPMNHGAVDGYMEPVSLTFSAPVDANSIATLRPQRDGQVLILQPEVSGSTVTFTPRDPWPRGAVYTLELSEQIRDLAGTALAPSTLHFSAPEGTWRPRSFADAGVDAPDIAVSSTGYAALVWTIEPSGTGTRDIWVSYYSLSTPWSASKSASGGGPQNRSHARVAINDVGQAAAVWERSEPTVEGTGYSGGVWLPVRELIQFARNPSVVVASSGRAFVAMSVETGGLGVKQHAFDVKGGLGATTESITQGVQAQSPSVVLLADRPLVAWTQNKLAESSVWVAGSPEVPRQQLSDAGVNASAADIATDVGGMSAIVVFEQVDNWRNIHAARIASGGTFAEPQVISDGASNASAPKVAVDAAGSALAAWVQKVAGRDQILAARYTVASGWKTALRISDDALGDASNPAVALEPGGNGFVVWLQAQLGDATKLSVWVARYVAGRGFDPTRRTKLSESESVAKLRPALGVDRAGRAFATWFEAGQVWIARFE